ncbi:MAG: ATP-binding cassette domain-containing protein [Persicimonas sp.]
MTVLRAANLAFAYGGRSELFSNIRFHLTNGWTGLVGPNGSGKTTLLELIRGHLQPSAGHVRLEPADARIAWCPQRIEGEGAVEHFATCWTGEALRWMSLMELDAQDFFRWQELSPGIRKRWQIAAALFDQPTIALLDEPTNHLDKQAKAVLARALDQFEGVGILVSHDRGFLDRMCASILWLESARLDAYEGGYTKARGIREDEMRRRRERLESLQRERRNLSSQLSERRERARRAQASIPTSSRSSGSRDSDARSMARKERASRATASLSDAAGALGSRLERVAADLGELSWAAERGAELQVKACESRKSVVARCVCGPIGYGDSPVFDELDVTLRRGQRIWLDAPNASGKTTLIAHLLAAKVEDTELLFLPQHLDEQRASSLLVEVRRLPDDMLGEVMQRVAALGVDPEALLRTEHPSPGEARKLMLARGLGRGCSLAVLDEPTNHLDIPSIERLEEALASYGGALLLVTHDEVFARQVTDERWTIAQRRLVRVPFDGDQWSDSNST